MNIFFQAGDRQRNPHQLLYFFYQPRTASISDQYGQLILQENKTGPHAIDGCQSGTAQPNHRAWACWRNGRSMMKMMGWLVSA
jgi:hypothetical protein